MLWNWWVKLKASLFSLKLCLGRWWSGGLYQCFIPQRFLSYFRNTFLLSSRDTAHGSMSSGVGLVLLTCIVELVSSLGLSHLWWNQKENLLASIHLVVAASLREFVCSFPGLVLIIDLWTIQSRKEILSYLSKYLEKLNSVHEPHTQSGFFSCSLPIFRWLGIHWFECVVSQELKPLQNLWSCNGKNDCKLKFLKVHFLLYLCRFGV